MSPARVLVVGSANVDLTVAVPRLPAAGETVSLGGLPLPGVVHEHTAHHARRDAEEMRAVLPWNRPLRNQAQIRFVDDRCRLERVTGFLAAKVSGGQTAKLALDLRHELCFSFGRSRPPPHQ